MRTGSLTFIDDAGLFHIRPEDYIDMPLAYPMQEALAIFQMIGLEPVSYQLGHRFFDFENRRAFMAMTEQTLNVAKFYLGRRVMWIPTIDEILHQAWVDGIRVSFFNAGRNISQTYRTLVSDEIYGNIPEELCRYTSFDPWIAVAVPVSVAYQRRFRDLGVEAVKRPIYTTDQAYADNPVGLTDQG